MLFGVKFICSDPTHKLKLDLSSFVVLHIYIELWPFFWCVFRLCYISKYAVVRFEFVLCPCAVVVSVHP